MTQTWKIRIENALIALLALGSVWMLFLSSSDNRHVQAAESSLQISFAMGQMVQRAFSIVLLVVSWQLMKRKRAALYIALSIFLLNFLRGLFGSPAPARSLLMCADALLFLLFFAFRSDFCCPSSKRSGRRAICVLGLCFLGIFCNAALSYHLLKAALIPGRERVLESIRDSFFILFGMGSPITLSRGAHLLETVLFWFSWACILASILYAVQPWLEQKRRTEEDVQHARTLLRLYGQNNCSYLALEADKELYFGKAVDGVIPYGTVGSVVVVNGDPVCADADFGRLLS